MSWLEAGFARDHHAAHAGTARRIHRRSARDRSARRSCRGSTRSSCVVSTAAYASSSATCSACRPGSANPDRDADGARALGLPRGGRCSHRASTRMRARARSKAAISSVGCARPRIIRRRWSSDASPPRSRPGSPPHRHHSARDGGHCRPACRSTGGACPTTRRFTAVDVIGVGGDTRIGTIANVSIPSRRARPRVPGRVQRLGRSVPLPSSNAGAGGTTILLSAAIGDVNPCHVHRQDNDCGGDGSAEAAQLGTDVARMRRRRVGRAPTALPVDGPEVTHRARARRHPRVDAADRRAGRTASFRSSSWSGRSGRSRLVSIPGEAFHALGRGDRRPIRRRGTHVLLAGLAPEWHGYLPSPFGDGYEESTSYGRRRGGRDRRTALTH